MKKRGTVPLVERLIDLSSWMMVLGTVRVIGMLADYVGIIVEATRVEPVTIRTLGRLADEIHPVVALGSAWPLILAFALGRTRWRQLLPAVAATFLILSIGGVIQLSVELSHATGYGGTIGSFHLNRRAFLNPRITDLAMGALGATQLLFEFATAIRAILLIARFRGTAAAPESKQARARGSRYGRMAIYTSFGFLVLMIRLPVWATYIEVLNNSTFVREFVIKSEGTRARGPRFTASYGAQPTEAEKRLQNLRYLLAASAQDARDGRFREAKYRYQRVITEIDSLPEDTLDSVGGVLLAQALNNLAWLEATCPNARFRNPQDAVRLARRATVVQPEEGNYWNTLGAALYRVDEWEDAKATFTRAMTLRGGGDSFDWFFLALVELKLGQKAEARDWYDKAVGWFHQSAPYDAELYRFQVEAAQELGLPEPKAPAVGSGKRAVPPPLQPRVIHGPARRPNPAEAPKTQD